MSHMYVLRIGLYLVFYAGASKRLHTWELRLPCLDSQPHLSSHHYICLWQLLILADPALKAIALRHNIRRKSSLFPQDAMILGPVKMNGG